MINMLQILSQMVDFTSGQNLYDRKWNVNKL